MEKTKRVIGVLICISVILLFICNIPNLILSLETKKSVNIRELREKIVQSYTSDQLFAKYTFVNINGLCMKICGRRAFNEVTSLNNGMLTGDVNSYLNDPGRSVLIDTLPEFSDYLKKIDTTFIYIQAPTKIDIKGEVLPAGLENYGNNRADELLLELNKKAVNTLDLRDKLAIDGNQVKRNFYKTDHHWNADGALKASLLIMERLYQIDNSIDITLMDPSLWERHTLDNWFLGSRGKRVGELYAGTDSLIWYTPCFKTSMSCIVPNRGTVLRGSFEKANLRERFTTYKDFFRSNPYCIYIGGNYPLVKHLNPEAPNTKNVLMISDSFNLPVQSFISTAFTEVNVIDPRYYDESTVKEYCEWYRPDYVIMMLNTGSIRDKSYTKMGGENKNQLEKEASFKTLLENFNTTVTIDEKTQVLPVTVKRDTVYMFSFTQFRVTRGTADGVSVALYDENNKTIIQHQIFDSEFSQQVNDLCWFFRVPDKDITYRLIIIPGINGKNNEENEIECCGISVSEMSYMIE